MSDVKFDFFGFVFDWWRGLTGSGWLKSLLIREGDIKRIDVLLK